jgi:hypothetical protein
VLAIGCDIERSEPDKYRHRDGYDKADNLPLGGLRLLRSANFSGGLHGFGHLGSLQLLDYGAALWPPANMPTISGKA